jgi:hypothetical protein
LWVDGRYAWLSLACTLSAKQLSCGGNPVNIKIQIDKSKVRASAGGTIQIGIAFNKENNVAV